MEKGMYAKWDEDTIIREASLLTNMWGGGFVQALSLSMSNAIKNVGPLFITI